ncbi:MAG: DUF367 domain-containing protein [Thermoplasmata archaeon]|nr:DUF367 domain-containing protein [Thermoplasmata archaeon]MCI4338264.1 DUF367 domain-containing protein [Thermoplasmata archaeon]MCI4341066.1 DUF367 domain-containing protein [Thermoplasmata archaeon]
MAGGFAQPAGRTRPRGGYPILLDPRAATPLSSLDRERARVDGLLAVDCSWNRIGLRGGFPAGLPGLGGQPHRRRLPFLRATNPQHFGRWAELNTAEALAAALFLLGQRDRAESLLDGFAGGPEFWRLNGSALAAFAACSTPEAVRAQERSESAPPAEAVER